MQPERSFVLALVGAPVRALVALLAMATAPAAAQLGGYIISTSTGAAIVPGTADVGNHCDDCTTAVNLPFALTLYGVSTNLVNVSSNGNIQFAGSTGVFGGNCLPNPVLTQAILPYQDDLRTDQGGTGIFASISGAAPNRIFNLEWRTTYFGRAGTANFEVRLFENQQRYDVIYGATADHGSKESSGVQEGDGQRYTQFSCNAPVLIPGLRVSYTATACARYTVTQADDVDFIGGSDDIGNHCDDCTTAINLPFPFSIYDISASTVTVSSNGNLQFTSNSSALGAICPPNSAFGATILAFQDDLLTNTPGAGVFTATAGVAPDRVFTIEWRVNFFGRDGSADFSVRLFENQPRFDVYYAFTSDDGASETAGVQRSGSGPFTAYSCSAPNLVSGRQLVFTCPDCPADLDRNGAVNIQDFLAFLQAFSAGCP
jgi:hypothetical protein